MPELLTDFASPTSAYIFLFCLLVLDAFVPVIPTQLVMITSGALTVHGGLSLPPTIAVGALGVFCGDLGCYLLGRTGWRLRIRRRRPATGQPSNLGDHSDPAGSHGEPAGGQAAVPSGTTERNSTDGQHSKGDTDGQHSKGGGATVPFARSRRAARHLTRGLGRTGPVVILICRFVPGGRMAAGFRAGRARYPSHLFAGYAAVAALGWSAYGTFVGHLGGTALAGSGWRMALIAAAAAAVFAAAGWAMTLAGARTRTATAPAPTDAALPPPTGDAAAASPPRAGTSAASPPPAGTSAAAPARPGTAATSPTLPRNGRP